MPSRLLSTSVAALGAGTLTDAPPFGETLIARFAVHHLRVQRPARVSPSKALKGCKGLQLRCEKRPLSGSGRAVTLSQIWTRAGAEPDLSSSAPRAAEPGTSYGLSLTRASLFSSSRLVSLRPRTSSLWASFSRCDRPLARLMTGGADGQGQSCCHWRSVGLVPLMRFTERLASSPQAKRSSGQQAQGGGHAGTGGRSLVPAVSGSATSGWQGEGPAHWSLPFAGCWSAAPTGAAQRDGLPRRGQCVEACSSPVLAEMPAPADGHRLASGRNEQQYHGDQASCGMRMAAPGRSGGFDDDAIKLVSWPLTVLGHRRLAGPGTAGARADPRCCR